MIRNPFRTPLLVGSLVVATLVPAQVVINEVSVSNFDSYADNFGEFEDWIELYNTTGAPVDISGWYLSDDPGDPTKWTIPAGTIVAAGARQLIFASGRDVSGGGFIHTSFKLNQTSADWVVLTNSGGSTIDDFQLADRTQLNHSRGRTTDGAATWSLFTTPTPGAANAGASPEYVAKPTLSQPAGYYSGSVSVAMSGPAGADIRYTLDGAAPTTGSTLYIGPISISSTTVVRAACFSTTPGVPASFIETNTYLINATHTVAVLSIAGEEVDDLLAGGWLEPFGSIEYFGPDHVLRDEAVGTFNEHGNDSWAYPQRGFDYVTRDQAGYNDALHYPIFRTQTRNKYQRLIVKAAANDNYPSSTGGAHIRDAYVHALSQMADLHLDERSYEPCVLYLNGQYWGVYEIREKADDHDYTKEYYDQDEFNLYYLKTWGGTWSEYGGAPAQTEWDALRAYINANNMGDPTAFAYVDARYNWKSLVDYFCINSYTVCTDWLNWNTAWWHGLDPAGEHKKWGYALWDNDATFGHYINYTGVPDDTPAADPCNAEQLPDPGGQGHTQILSKLIAENPTVHDYYVNRYIDLGNTYFSCDFMLPFLDSLIANIDGEMTAHCAKWGGTYADWQANVQALRDFIDLRCVAVQDGMVDCYDVTGPFPVVFMVDPPLSGQIQVNSMVLPSYPFNGTYYGGINTNLLALPSSGWTFGYWEILNDTIQPSLTDSAAWLTIDVPDTIIAHFVPPISHDVVVLTDPPNSASVLLGGTMITSFPHLESVPEGVSMPLKVFPNPYFQFMYWEVLHNDFLPADSTLPEVDITFYSTDTIIAHLDPDEYGYYVPNSFTPNGDGINDVWYPTGNAVDITNYQLEIYDRWGERIFASTDPGMGWNGSSGGGDAPIGVYVFRAHVVDGITRDKHEFIGHVTLVR